MPPNRKAPEPAPFPERIGRYELLLPIASGGMATVYLARARGMRGFESDVALKLMHPHLSGSGEADEAGIDLVEEAKLAARIRHRNVVPVLDVGEDAHGVFLVMQYVEGDSLGALLHAAHANKEPLPVSIALSILSDALSGLHAAHELCDRAGAALGLVHRDFSPQNILVGVDGATMLTDFGIAKATSREGLTQTGIVKGKVGYMSPEQARGALLDRRSDVWAAGVVAWEVLAGRRLYRTSDPVATALEIVGGAPRRLRSVRPDIPAAVDEAIAEALTGNLERRCPTAEAFRLRLLDAWPVPLADVAEVGAHVRRVAGAKIDERRRRAEASARLRAAVTEAEVIASPSSRADAAPAVARKLSPRWALAAVAMASIAAAAAFGIYASAAISKRSAPAVDVEGAASVTPRPSSSPVGDDLATRPASAVDPPATESAPPASSVSPAHAPRAPVARPIPARSRPPAAPSASATLLGASPYEKP